MARAIYPGTFDPPTLGHEHIISRGVDLFDHLIIAVSDSVGQSPNFTQYKRIELLKTLTAQYGNHVSIVPISGLLVDVARTHDAQVILRGIRDATDLDYEAQMARANRTLCDKLDTLFMVPEGNVQAISSSLVREIAQLGGSIDAFVSSEVKKALS